MLKIGDRVIDKRYNVKYEVTNVHDNAIQVKVMQEHSISHPIHATHAWTPISLFEMDDVYYRKLREDKINSIMYV